MDWTTGPLDYFWTILESFFGRFFQLFEGRYSSRRDGSQTVVSEGGVKDELSIRREGCEVDVLVTASDL